MTPHAAFLWLICASLAVFAVSCFMSLNAAERAFTPTDEIIANPGCGWECSAGFYPVFKDLCNVGAIYERVTWASIEPEEGKFTWGPLEFAAQTAEKAGIPFYFRIMCVNSYSGGPYDTPKWVFDKGAKSHPGEPSRIPKVVPEFDDPVFVAAHRRFIRALAERYDCDPRLGGLDIGSYGNFGEWHVSGIGCGKEYWNRYSASQRRPYAEMYVESFARAQLVAMTDDDETLGYLLSLGSSPRVGIRRDGVGSPWHFGRWIGTKPYDRIPRMGEVWKTQPIVLEFFCGANNFIKKGWDIGNSVDWILANHASLVHTIPFDPRQVKDDAKVMAEVRRIDRRAGARIVPLRAEWSVDEAGRVQVRIEGRNDGVAPIILDYRLVYEARDAAGKALGRWVSSANPRGWLPGPFAVRDTLASSGPLPNDMRLFVWLESCGGRFRNFRFGVKECDDSGLLSL